MLVEAREQGWSLQSDEKVLLGRGTEKAPESDELSSSCEVGQSSGCAWASLLRLLFCVVRRNDDFKFSSQLLQCSTSSAPAGPTSALLMIALRMV